MGKKGVLAGGAFPTLNLADITLSALNHRDPGANTAGVVFCADYPDLEPVVAVFRVVAEEAQAGAGANHQIEIAVVVKISQGTAPAVEDPGAGKIGGFRKGVVAEEVLPAGSRLARCGVELVEVEEGAPVFINGGDVEVEIAVVV